MPERSIKVIVRIFSCANSNKVSSIDELRVLNNLQTVAFMSNEISDISPLFNSRNLEELNIVGRVNTIRCEQVEHFLSEVSFKIHDSWRERCH